MLAALTIYLLQMYDFINLGKQQNVELLFSISIRNQSKARVSLAQPFRQSGKKVPLTVTLNADVTEIFKTLEAVNNPLCALISAIPKTER